MESLMVRRMRVSWGVGVWVVDTGARRFLFTSGAEAERWGRDRARELAAQGEDVELTVSDRQGRIVGRLTFKSPFATAGA